MAGGDAVFIDARSNGGGVETNNLEEALLVNYKLAYTPPISPSGGYSYPKYATHVIRVPYTLLKEYGGDLEKKAIRNLIEKHMSAGEYPVIIYDGVIPEFISITPESGCVKLRWELEDPTYRFIIYRSLYIDKKFEKIATVDGTTYGYNEYRNCGLTQDVTYYFKIHALSLGEIESPSSTVYGAKVL